MTRPAALVLLGTLVATAAAAQGRGPCPWWDRPDPATIGVVRLLCRGGSCAINVEEEDGLAHRFSTEPVIQELAPGAPSELRQGDVLVAVDGVLITTVEGGRRLARLRVGRPVTLTLRRDGRRFDVRVVPRSGCPIGSLSVRIPG